MKISNVLALLILVSCNSSKVVTTTGPKTPSPTDEVIVSAEKTQLRFICAGGSLNSQILIFKANAQPHVSPSLISLVNETRSLQIVGVEELTPLYDVNAHTVRVVFRAKEYEQGSSLSGDWKSYYYLADVDYINRKIVTQKIGVAPNFNLLARDYNFVNGPNTHVGFFEKENKVLLPVLKDGGFFYGWYSLDPQEILSVTNVSAHEYYNPVVDSPYIVFDHFDIASNKFEKTIINLDRVVQLPQYDQVGPTVKLAENWYWLGRDGANLKISSYSKQKSENKNFDFRTSSSEKVFSGAVFSEKDGKVGALIPVESLDSGKGELRKVEINLATGSSVRGVAIPYPGIVKSVGKQNDSPLVIGSLFDNKSEIFAAFEMPDGSSRFFKFTEQEAWQQVSRASCRNVRAWQTKEVQ